MTKELSEIPPLTKANLDKVKETFLEWSSRTDMNCYTKIFVYSKYPLVRFVWFLIFLASSCLTFWLCNKSILDYFNYPVVSQIGTAYESKSLFPTVTICDTNPFTTRQAEALYERVAQQNGIYPNDSGIFSFAKIIASSSQYDEEAKKSFGFNLTQIHSCSFQSGQKREQCNMTQDFDWIWMYDYGNCWQFNSGLNTRKSNLKEAYNGVDFGLDLRVSLRDIENKYLSLGNVLSGLVVFIHNNSFRPNSIEKAQVYVESEKKTFIGVKRIFNFKLPQPYSQCIDLNGYSSELYDLITSNRTYRQSDCFKLCRQKFYIEKCGCNALNDIINVNNNVKLCSNLSEQTCSDSIYFSFSREECERNWCPLECDSVEYDLCISSLAYSNGGKSENALKSMLATVHLIVYYPTLEYTFVKESPQTTELDLFGTVGGTLGIFISFSLFTLLEIFEIIILVIRAWLF
jgi:hypothetical protein